MFDFILKAYTLTIYDILLLGMKNHAGCLEKLCNKIAKHMSGNWDGYINDNKANT